MRIQKLRCHSWTLAHIKTETGCFVVHTVYSQLLRSDSEDKTCVPATKFEVPL